MRNSTYWSLFCLAMALVNMKVGRDISSNIFLGVFMVIQGLSRDSMAENHSHRVRLILAGLSAAIIISSLAHK